jgi:hypothetical protein
LLVSQDPVNTPIKISVSEIKESITGTEGVQAINQIIEAQPPCTLDQLVGLVQVGLGLENSVGSILCRPPDFILSEINPLVETFLTATVGQIPDTIQFNLPLSQLDNQSSGISKVDEPEYIPELIQDIRQLNTLISWSPLLPLAFLLLMTLAAVRSLKDFMTWWGGALFTAGSISLVFSAMLAPAVGWVSARYLPMDLISSIDMPEILVNIGLVDFYAELLNQLQMSIIIPAVIITAIGFALLLGQYLLSRFSPKMKSQPGSTQVVQSSG